MCMETTPHNVLPFVRKTAKRGGYDAILPNGYRLSVVTDEERKQLACGAHRVEAALFSPSGDWVYPDGRVNFFTPSELRKEIARAAWL